MGDEPPVAEERARSRGRRRASAREIEAPPRRGVMGCVTAVGALVILVVVGFVVAGYVRDRRRTSELVAARTTFAPLLEDARVARIVERFRPAEQPMPPPATLQIGEQTESPYTVAEGPIEGAPRVAADARGLLVMEGDVAPIEVDVAQLAGSRRAASLPDDVRWIGVVERQVMEGEYRYDAVDVSVERAYVVIVDLATERPVTRLTIEAAPPSHAAVPRTVYPIVEQRIWQAIERALR